MNIFGYNQADKTGFKDFLIARGYTSNGADEIIRRISENRPDREDINSFRRYKAERQ